MSNEQPNTHPKESAIKNIWGSKNRFEEPVQTAPTVGKPMKKIKMGFFDPLIVLALTLVSQVIISAVAVFVWFKNNSDSLAEMDNTSDAVAAATEALLDGPFILMSSVGMYLVWYLGMLFVSKKRGFGSFKKDYWLKFRKKDLLIGLTFAVSMRLTEFGVINGLNAAGVDMSGADNSSVFTNLDGIWLFINAFIIASFVGPIMEELVFRGLMLQSFLRCFRLGRPSRSKHKDVDITNTQGMMYLQVTVFFEKVTNWFFRHGNLLALLLTSTIFGFMHFQGFDNFGQVFVVVWTGLIGLVLGIITMRTKRLGGAIIGHILFNFSGVALSLI